MTVNGSGEFEANIEKFLAPELKQLRVEQQLGKVEQRLYERAYQDFERYSRERNWPIGAHALAGYLIESGMSHGARQIVVAAYFYRAAVTQEPVLAALKHCAQKDRAANAA